MTSNPTQSPNAGGRWIRDPETGAVRRATPEEDGAAPADVQVAAAKTDAAEPADDGGKRREKRTGAEA